MRGQAVQTNTILLFTLRAPLRVHTPFTSYVGGRNWTSPLQHSTCVLRRRWTASGHHRPACRHPLKGNPRRQGHHARFEVSAHSQWQTGSVRHHASQCGGSTQEEAPQCELGTIVDSLHLRAVPAPWNSICSTGLPRGPWARGLLHDTYTNALACQRPVPPGVPDRSAAPSIAPLGALVVGGGESDKRCQK